MVVGWSGGGVLFGASGAKTFPGWDHVDGKGLEQSEEVFVPKT